ncbi:uncharacterized protein EAF01_005985 [Botrytis porri]|uniref:Uncharacterized protein n=1 Tax=Botrytis porri TaxID=87229 RepID=A0A4Z1K8X8_9HELO|nr:uncharacterized protein EAF01_005985 [Botrytis porri]KAF7905464.1 hypothetical protein EAF01_005985 [Botrytis porri]TGO81926.1 hypothetical protein BPOR_0969g00010 [Botrytis porri]
MEDTSEMGVVQDNFGRIGGNYAPENSHVPSQNNLIGLTPPSFEQYNDQNSLGFQDDYSLWGSFSMEENNLQDNSLNQYSLWNETGNLDDLYNSGPKCPDNYVEPPVHKRRKFNSDSITKSSPFESATQEVASPITESLSVFSQQAMPIRKTTESTSPSNAPSATSEVFQQAIGQESILSQAPPSGLQNSFDKDGPTTSSNGHATDIQTVPATNSASSASNYSHLSQPITSTIVTAPEIIQTPSATHMLSIPESHQIGPQQPCGVTGVPLGSIFIPSPQKSQMRAASDSYSHQVSPNQPHAQRRPFTAFPPQNLGFTPFRRSFNQQATPGSRDSIQALQQATEQGSRLFLPSRPTSSGGAAQKILPQSLDRSSIPPQLREVMEKFENKIRMDADLRNAFNIVFPSRSMEVEELKQKIINERLQASQRENALKSMLTELQDNATAQEALQTRAMGLLTQLRANPQHDRSWVCRNFNKEHGQPCNNVQKEFYLTKKVWKRRERCSKCKAKVHELNRQYLNDDTAVASWNFEQLGPFGAPFPAPPEFQRPGPMDHTVNNVNQTEKTSTVWVDSVRRQSLPTLPVDDEDVQQNTESRWASLPPPTKKTRDHTPLNYSKATQNALRAALGTQPKAWMQPPKHIETIVLDDESDHDEEKGQSQESFNETPAAEQETGVENTVDADFEADFDAEFEAELEADLTTALETEIA